MSGVGWEEVLKESSPSPLTPLTPKRKSVVLFKPIDERKKNDERRRGNDKKLNEEKNKKGVDDKKKRETPCLMKGDWDSFMAFDRIILCEDYTVTFGSVNGWGCCLKEYNTSSFKVEKENIETLEHLTKLSLSHPNIVKILGYSATPSSSSSFYSSLRIFYSIFPVFLSQVLNNHFEIKKNKLYPSSPSMSTPPPLSLPRPVKSIGLSVSSENVEINQEEEMIYFPFPGKLLVKFLLDLLYGLLYLSKYDIFPLILKPENICVHYDSNREPINLLISDYEFGLKSPPQIEYAAPEIIRKENSKPETIVWSLGMIIYHLLTLTPPYYDIIPHQQKQLSVLQGIRPEIDSYIKQMDDKNINKLVNLFIQATNFDHSSRPTLRKILEEFPEETGGIIDISLDGVEGGISGSGGTSGGGGGGNSTGLGVPTSSSGGGSPSSLVGVSSTGGEEMEYWKLEEKLNREWISPTYLVNESKIGQPPTLSHHPSKGSKHSNSKQKSAPSLLLSGDMIKVCEGFKIEFPRYDAPRIENTILRLVDDWKNIPYYQQFLYGRDRTFVYEDEENPYLISINDKSLMSYKSEKVYQALIRDKDEDTRLVIRSSSSKERDIIKALKSAHPPLSSIKLHEIKSCGESGLDFEKRMKSNLFKFGVVYCKSGQTDESQMLQNAKGSEQFEEFLDFIGTRTELKGYKGFSGGLDTEDDGPGGEFLQTSFSGCQIVFHVSTMLPDYVADPQRVAKKKHIGNDVVVIIFKDSTNNDDRFSPSAFRSHFNHIFFVVQPDSPTTLKVGIIHKDSVPTYSPALPYPPIFEKNEQFRNFFLTKLLNAERTAIRTSKSFSIPLRRARQQLLQMSISSAKKYSQNTFSPNPSNTKSRSESLTGNFSSFISSSTSAGALNTPSLIPSNNISGGSSSQITSSSSASSASSSSPSSSSSSSIGLKIRAESVDDIKTSLISSMSTPPNHPPPPLPTNGSSNVNNSTLSTSASPTTNKSGKSSKESGNISRIASHLKKRRSISILSSSILRHGDSAPNSPSTNPLPPVPTNSPPPPPSVNSNSNSNFSSTSPSDTSSQSSPLVSFGVARSQQQTRLSNRPNYPPPPPPVTSSPKPLSVKDIKLIEIVNTKNVQALKSFVYYDNQQYRHYHEINLNIRVDNRTPLICKIIELNWLEGARVLYDLEVELVVIDIETGNSPLHYYALHVCSKPHKGEGDDDDSNNLDDDDDDDDAVIPLGLMSRTKGEEEREKVKKEKEKEIQFKEMVRETIRKAPELLNMRNKNGESALHLACLVDNFPFVECLIEFEGIDLSATNNDGIGIDEYAMTGNSLDIIQLLGSLMEEKDLK